MTSEIPKLNLRDMDHTWYSMGKDGENKKERKYVFQKRQGVS
jgi:hypothetical protein